MNDRLQRALRQLPYFPWALQLIWGAAPRLTLGWGGLLLLQSALPVAQVYLTKKLVDSLVSALNASFSWEGLRPLLLWSLFMGGVLLLSEVLQALMEWVRSAQAEYVQDHLTDLVQDKSMAVDLAFYESPEYYDHLQRAQSDAGARSLALLENMGELVQHSLTLVGVAFILMPYGAWLPALLLIATVPALFIALRFNQINHDWWRKTTADRRWTQYYHTLLTTAYVSAEVRIFNLGPFFQSAYQFLRKKLRSERLSLLRSQGLSRLMAGLFALIVASLAVMWIAWQAIQGRFSLGDLALFYQAYQRGQSLMRALIGALGQLYSNSLYLSDLHEFLMLAPQVVSPPQPDPIPALTKEIRLHQVTFRYPNSDRYVLRDFNLVFPVGKITAIVGENGAGKSTLVKLLCRFYDPEGGRIEWDGVDLKNMDLPALRRMITVLFQLPVTFYTTAAQNITFGDLGRDAEKDEVELAARQAGAHEIISRLPRGYETLLGKLFAGGAELSLGEWQRIALARAFFRQAPIVVLDEPTSFMDSWAEADWMARFHDLVAGRTVILITHRFTTARHADLIHVMRSGQIVESGSHGELLAREGLYAQSWNAQMHGKLGPLPHLVDENLFIR
jgi:ATP-binding cassette subfamily B protein